MNNTTIDLQGLKEICMLRIILTIYLPLKLLEFFGADSLSECVFKSNCWITFNKITFRNLAGQFHDKTI